MLNDMNVVGQWYQRPDTREIFQVIDWDDRSDAVRVQMFDGSLDELETDSWRSLSPEPVAAPKDCTGPLDNVEPDEGDEWGEES
ncbi:MAG TPA: DUF6763 family protein, partial [Verrucomicrobiae bacterium]|nr:DUF6763 family protein [Verrucomicrobiae bacterium]